MKEIICTSCKTKLTNMVGAVRFKCPNCSEADIIRCAHCRKISAKYKCSNCNFSGPN